MNFTPILNVFLYGIDGKNVDTLENKLTGYVFRHELISQKFPLEYHSSLVMDFLCVHKSDILSTVGNVKNRSVALVDQQPSPDSMACALFSVYNK